MQSLDHFKSMSGSAMTKNYSISLRPPSDSASSGSFANLKLTAEKLVKEQASAKSDLDLANAKLKKLTEYIHSLEDKLQSAINENAKVKVKQKEDEKLWKGLESKFTSTKTLCDQLTETLQHLAGQVQYGEKDKEFLEDKLSASAAALENSHQQMKALSLKLDASEEAVQKCEKEFERLNIEKQEMVKYFKEELCKASNLIEEKDARVKHLDATVEANRLDIENLNLKMETLHLSLRSKDEDLKSSRVSEETLMKEKNELVSSNEKFMRQLDMALRDIKNLENFVNFLSEKLIELDNQSAAYMEQVVQLNALHDSCCKLVQEEKDLSSQRAKGKYYQIQRKFMLLTSERDALGLVNEQLSGKIIGLHKDLESALEQHREDIRVAEEKIHSLEIEAESLLSTKSKLELLIASLEEKINSLFHDSSISESKLQDYLAKIAALESENKDTTEKLSEDIRVKTEEADGMKKEIEANEQLIDSVKKQVDDFQTLVKEKEELILQSKKREKQLEDQKSEVQVSLVDAENKLADAKRQYDQMLESKQSELSRHLKELSQRNDKAINDIRRKFEADKLESLNLEKEKAARAIEEMESKREETVAECKEEARQYLVRIQEEHASLITCMQQDHDKKEMSLKSDHSEELKHVKAQAEIELRQKIMQLKTEYEGHLKSMRSNHEDECRKLQEELEAQKDKEEKQRALLQLQWKVMGDKPQEDQEVNSIKNYSKTKNSDGNKRSQRSLVNVESEPEDAPYYPRESQTPVTNLLKEVEKGKTGSAMNIPKHSRKVTHHEYEVETANGRTITKRKTKSTVLFADPRKHKKRQTPKENTPSAMLNKTKVGKTNPSNIGDLFSEGSLNPYADDPYAFD